MTTTKSKNPFGFEKFWDELGEETTGSEYGVSDHADCTGSRGRSLSSSIRRRRRGGSSSVNTDRCASTTTKRKASKHRRERIPVIYDQEKIGFLSISSKYLCFTATTPRTTSTTAGVPPGGMTEEKWEWKNLSRVIANGATSYMKIGHRDTTKQSMFFQFESSQDLMEATNEFQSYILENAEEDEEETLPAAPPPHAEVAMPAAGECNTPLSTVWGISKTYKIKTPTLEEGNIDKEEGLMIATKKETPILISVSDIVENEMEQNNFVGLGGEQEDQEPLLTKDAYSLLYTSDLCSRTALFAWFSIILQVGMLLVNFFDLFDTSKEGNDTNGEPNRMQVKVGSTAQVMIAQFLGMLLTAMVMAAEGDFVIGITKLIKGYSPEIRQQSHNATCGRWLFTGILQSFSGLLLLINSFILSMQSAAVIELSLNLTALYFLQEIDDMAFVLGSETGLLGQRVQEDCEHVENLKGHFTEADRRRILVLRRLLISAMTIGLLIPYFLVINQQADGYYLCNNLYVQFGDEFTPEMAHYSGMFRSQGNGIHERIGQRNYYVDDTISFKLAYCNADNYWTFSRMYNSPCEYVFRSAQTTTFDIIEAADLDWYVKPPFSGDIGVDWLMIVCNDCNTDICPPDYGVCSEDGDKCICHGKRFGLNCQFWDDCLFYGLDERTSDGLTTIPGTSSFLDAEYTSLYIYTNSTALFYDMPIYLSTSDYSEAYSMTITANLTEKETLPLIQVNSFIVYTGRRWVLYSIPDEIKARIVKIYGRPSNLTLTDFNTFFNEATSYPTGIDALMKMTEKLQTYFPLFFSSPVNYAEASLVGGDVTHVTWTHATQPHNRSNPIIPAFADEGNPVPAKFLCTNCFDRTNASDIVADGSRCLNGGYCNDNGHCICETYYKGYQCERVMDCVGAGGCSGVGKCNENTKTCKCDEGSYGSLCQLGLGALPDPFLCNMCVNGECNSTFSQQCICDDGYGGKYCNETVEIK